MTLIDKILQHMDEDFADAVIDRMDEMRIPPPEQMSKEEELEMVMFLLGKRVLIVEDTDKESITLEFLEVLK